MLNELLSVTPPKVRKKANFMVTYIYICIYKENYIWISNHTDHQPLADLDFIRCRMMNWMSYKSIPKCQDKGKKVQKRASFLPLFLRYR